VLSRELQHGQRFVEREPRADGIVALGDHPEAGASEVCVVHVGMVPARSGSHW
jgi:hypothetical protein